MGYNAQARKWLMVINNPAEAGLDHACYHGNRTEISSNLFLHG